MLALIILVGLLSAMLVVTIGVAYLALPSGRMCPRCGGPTVPVTLRVIQRIVKKWLQWRWCSRCGWEGAGRNGPDVAPFDPPVDHDSGFRWSRPDGREVPIFWWGSDRETPQPPVVGHPSGFRWKHPTPKPHQPAHPSGFEFGARDQRLRTPSVTGRKPDTGFKWKDQRRG
jgi:rubredoxin